MASEIAGLLSRHLVFEDNSLRDLLDETMDLLQTSGGSAEAIHSLEANWRVYFFNIDFLNEVPYRYLFLSFAYSKIPDYPSAIKWAKAAIQGLDQRDRVWNSAIARWVCAILFQTNHQFEEAQVCYKAAIRLMKKEIQDKKRQSRYQEAKGKEIALSQMIADMDSMHRNQSSSSSSDIANKEKELYEDLLSKAGGDRKMVERWINVERDPNKKENRVQLMEKTKYHWEKDNR